MMRVVPAFRLVGVLGVTLGVGFGVACGTSTQPTQRPDRVEREPPREPRPVQPAAARQDFKIDMSPASLVSTGKTLVWTDGMGGVWAMPSTGGTPKQLSSQQAPGFAFSLLLAGSHVLATSRRDILRIVTPDGPVTKLGITGLPDQPEEAVADDKFLYVTIFKHDQVMRVRIDGGHAEQLAEVKRGVLGLHAGTLYIASYSTGVLYSLPGSGGKLHEIVRGLPRPTAVAADATHAFVYCERDETLRRIELATGAMITLASGLRNSDDILLDGAYAYTRSWGKPGKLVRVAKDGSTPVQTLASDLTSPYRIAADATAIYVTSRDDRRIIRLDKAALPR